MKRGSGRYRKKDAKPVVIFLFRVIQEYLKALKGSREAKRQERLLEEACKIDSELESIPYEEMERPLQLEFL